jgi:hypothetical protein
MSQIVDRFQEFAALLSYLSKLLGHLYPSNRLRQKTLKAHSLTLKRDCAQRLTLPFFAELPRGLVFSWSHMQEGV